ncbi:hypothetical protein Tco_0641540 [Tanacetum coccineum]
MRALNALLRDVYGRKCRAPICWVKGRCYVFLRGPEMIEWKSVVLVSRGSLVLVSIGDRLRFLIALVRFPYRLALPPQLSHVHNVFHDHYSERSGGTDDPFCQNPLEDHPEREVIGRRGVYKGLSILIFFHDLIALSWSRLHIILSILFPLLLDIKVRILFFQYGILDDAEMFDTDALIGNEVFAKNDMIEKDQDVIPKEVSIVAPSTTAVSPPVITESTATIAPSTIPKAKGITFRDAGESTTRIPTLVSSSSIKDKGKAKMDEPEVPLKKKDQIALDKEMARNLEAQIQAELIEEERLAKKKEEEANIALIESWDNTQVMMEADFKLAQRLQAEEQGEITIKERSRLFVELMNKRKKHFAKIRAEEKIRKPPTKAQMRNLMSTYLKNMGGYKYNQLKSKSYDEIQKLFDNEMKRVNTFIPMDLENAKSSEKKAEGSRKKSIGKKRAGKEQKQESSKRQRMEDDKETDEHE